jgi:mono/diheme cytochrome c family protein
MRLISFFLITALFGGCAAWAWSERYPELAMLEKNDNAIPSIADLEAGQELVLLGNCESCHTQSGGQPFAGGYAIKTEFGTLYSSNITPDRETGIGTWSYNAFRRAMRHGVDRKGNHLYPAFPYDRFAGLKEEDIASIYAFLKTEVAPVRYEPSETKMSFPWSIRQGLAGWKLLFHAPAPWAEKEGKSDKWRRGAYLAETIGHCGSCHSPRNFLGAEKKEKNAYSGGFSGSWYAPALIGEGSKIGGLDKDNLVNYLLDGWDLHLGVASGPMIKVANNLYDVNEDDAYAIAEYFLDLNSSGSEKLVLEENFDAIVWQKKPKNLSETVGRGNEIFVRHCKSCHKLGGKPSTKGFFAVLNQPFANNFVHVVVEGIAPAYGSAEMLMPAKGNSLTNAELADLLTFLRETFSDKPVWENLHQTIGKIRTKM